MSACKIIWLLLFVVHLNGEFCAHDERTSFGLANSSTVRARITKLIYRRVKLQNCFSKRTFTTLLYAASWVFTQRRHNNWIQISFITCFAEFKRNPIYMEGCRYESLPRSWKFSDWTRQVGAVIKWYCAYVYSTRVAGKQMCLLGDGFNLLDITKGYLWTGITNALIRKIKRTELHLCVVIELVSSYRSGMSIVFSWRENLDEWISRRRT